MGYYQKDIECMPREELKKIQDERLVWQVKRMYERVELFRKRMDEKGLKPEDIKGIKDLSKLPFSYKQDLRDYYPFGLFAEPLKNIVSRIQTPVTIGIIPKKIMIPKPRELLASRFCFFIPLTVLII